MGYVEESAIMHLPVEVIWYALEDIAHTPEWVVGLEKAEIATSGPYGAGTIYIDYNRLGPFLQTTPWHVTVYEPFSRQVHESASKIIPTTLILSVAPAPRGTRVTLTFEYRLLPQLGPVGRLLERLVMNRLINHVAHQNLVQLDAYLQQQASASPSLA